MSDAVVAAADEPATPIRLVTAAEAEAAIEALAPALRSQAKLAKFRGKAGETLTLAGETGPELVLAGLGDGAGAMALRRALFLYAFGQALHFAIWLRLVPEVERAAPLPHPFRRALALFEADFGRWARPLLVACVLATPLLLLGGGAAREAYFALGYFHVGLEAAALARRPSPP